MSNKVARAPSQTKGVWHEHIRQWRNSGLSKADYCREHNLKASNFYNWSSGEPLVAKPQVRTNRSTPLKLIPLSVVNTDVDAESVHYKAAV